MDDAVAAPAAAPVLLLTSVLAVKVLGVTMRVEPLDAELVQHKV